MSLILAASILVIAPVPEVEQVDAAYDDVANGRNAEAIVRLDDSPSGSHPASLINLGIAYAREGDRAAAQRLFERAAAMSDRYELETAGGGWVDSRVLARKDLAALESGAFARSNTVRTASR